MSKDYPDVTFGKSGESPNFLVTEGQRQKSDSGYGRAGLLTSMCEIRPNAAKPKERKKKDSAAQMNAGITPQQGTSFQLPKVFFKEGGGGKKGNIKVNQKKGSGKSAANE